MQAGFTVGPLGTAMAQLDSGDDEQEGADIRRDLEKPRS